MIRPLASRQIGRTELKITTLGLGGATFAGVAPVEIPDAVATIERAFASGVTYFDTAPQYGYGKSEHLVGCVVRNQSGYCISTKVGRRLRPLHRERPAGDIWHKPLQFEPFYDFSYDGVMRAHEDSLQRLGLDHVDILLVHDPDVYVLETRQGPAEFRAAVESAWKALDVLRSAGSVKAIGLGVNDAKPIADALDWGRWDVFMLAGRYTLLEQAPLKTLFPAVERHGASIIIAGPFNSGILAGRDTWNYARVPEELRLRVDAIARVCAGHGVPLPAAALQFPLAHHAVAATVPGPRSAAEFDQILGWWNTPIPPALWSDLKAEKLLDASAPVPARM
jgi:D-threo-aldose 1-dehydrogenase